MRIRTIKPEFFKHDGIAELPPLSRLFFIGLWCVADRDGRLADRPARLKIEILPYDEADADLMLNELAKGGFINRYTEQGMQIVQVLSFNSHQRITGKEADIASRFPAFNGETSVKHPGSIWETSGKHPGNIQDASGKSFDEKPEKNGSDFNFEFAGSHQHKTQVSVDESKQAVECEQIAEGETLGKQRGNIGETPGSTGREGKGKEGNEEGKDIYMGFQPKKEEAYKPTPNQIRLNALFRRRDSTRWDKKELAALKAIEPIDEADFAVVLKWYSAKLPPDQDFRRRDLITLLNNWNGEVDRARKYKPATCF